MDALSLDARRAAAAPHTGGLASLLRRLAMLLLLPAVIAGCASTPHNLLAFPGPRVKDGVRLEVTTIAGTWTRPLGLGGSVENLSDQPVPYIKVRLDGLGYQGSTIAEASTEIRDLRPGEKRRFRANFPLPAPHGLHQVMIGELRVVR